MAAAETARLIAELELGRDTLSSGLAGVDRKLSHLEGSLGRVGKAGGALTTAVGVGVERLAEKGIGLLFDNLRSGEEGLRRLQDITSQTGAVIESTGGKAGVSADQVRALAEASEKLTTVDDKTVQAGENLLLTFTGIGSDIFPAATKAMVDMAVAMNGGNVEGIDLKDTAIQIGKALQDPIKGATTLRRVGVQLTDQQQEQIKAFVKSGDVMSAQKVILGELQTEFGKAGEAAGKSGAAGIRRLADAVEDSQIALAKGLSPALDRIRGKITEALADPKTQRAIEDLGRFLGDATEKGLAFASSIPWAKVGDGLKTAAKFAGDLIGAFTNLPPEAQAAIIGLAGLNKLSGGAVGSLVGELGKGLIKGVLGMNAAVVNLNAGTVNGAGGAGGAAGGAGKLKSGLAVVGAALAVGAAIETQQQVSAASTAQAQGIHESLKVSLASSPGLSDLQTKLGAIDTGIADIQRNPLLVLVQGDALDQLKAMRDEVRTQIQAQIAAAGSADAKVYDSLERNRLALVTRLDTVAGSITGLAGDTRSEAAAIRGIKFPAPVVNVQTTVNATFSVRDQQRQTRIYAAIGAGRVFE